VTKGDCGDKKEIAVTKRDFGNKKRDFSDKKEIQKTQKTKII
jgi:hypothetical protein